MRSRNPMPLHLGDPLDLDDGREAAHVLATYCREAVRDLARAHHFYAQAELEYRRELALAMAEIYSELGKVTMVDDLARGNPRVANLRHTRDLARAGVSVAKERLRQLDGERASLRQLLEWSQKFDGNRQFAPPRAA